MPLPIHPNAGRGAGAGTAVPVGSGLLHDPSHFTDVFLGAFRRDLLSFYPGCRLEREPTFGQAAGSGGVSFPHLGAGTGQGLVLDFQLADAPAAPGRLLDEARVSLFGAWYRISVPRSLGFGPRDRELIRAIGRVMELHYQVLFRASRVSLLQLRRGMPEDHYVAAAVDPSAYSPAASAPSRIAEAILTLRTMALSTYENRRVTTGAIITGSSARCSGHTPGETPPEALVFGVELTGLKTLHRLCDGRRTLFLVDVQGRLADLVDIRQWALCEACTPHHQVISDPSLASELNSNMEPVLTVPCPRVYSDHALATRSGGHVCLVLSPNQEIKVFAAGVQAFVFAHGRWRVQDPEAKFARWSLAVANAGLARSLFQTALDLAEDRQGGLLVVVTDPVQAIGRLVSPHDVLADPATANGATGDEDSSIDRESPARPFSLFGLISQDDEPLPTSTTSAAEEPLSKRSIHYLARGLSVTELDATVLEALASLDGALVTDAYGRLLAFGAILRHDALALAGPDPTNPPAIAEGARTTAALVASRFGPVLKISEDGIVSCFLDGTRVWDL